MENRLSLVFVVLILSGLVSAKEVEKVTTEKKNPIINLFETPLKAFQTKPGEAIAVFQPEIVRQSDGGGNNQNLTNSWFQAGQSIGSQVSSLTGWLTNRLYQPSSTTPKPVGPEIIVDVQQIKPNQNGNIPIRNVIHVGTNNNNNRRRPVNQNNIDAGLTDNNDDGDFDDDVNQYEEEQRIDNANFVNDGNDYDDNGQQQDVVLPLRNNRRQMINRNQIRNGLNNGNRNVMMNMKRNQNNQNRIRNQNMNRRRQQQQQQKQQQQNKNSNRRQMQPQQQNFQNVNRRQNAQRPLNNNMNGNNGGFGNTGRRYNGNDRDDYEDDDDDDDAATFDNEDYYIEDSDKNGNDDDDFDDDDDFGEKINKKKKVNSNSDLDDYEAEDYGEYENYTKDKYNKEYDYQQLGDEDDDDDIDNDKNGNGNRNDNDFDDDDDEDEYVDLQKYDPIVDKYDPSNRPIAGFRPLQSIPIGGNGHVDRINQMHATFPTNAIRRRQQLLLMQQQQQDKQKEQQQNQLDQKQKQQQQQQQLQEALLNNQHIIIPIHFIPDSIPYKELAPQAAPQAHQIQVVAQHHHTVQNTSPAVVQVHTQNPKPNRAQNLNRPQNANRSQNSNRPQNFNRPQNLNQQQNANQNKRKPMNNRRQNVVANNSNRNQNRNRKPTQQKQPQKQPQNNGRQTTKKPQKDDNIFYSLNLIAPGPATGNRPSAMPTRPTRRPPTKKNNPRAGPSPVINEDYDKFRGEPPMIAEKPVDDKPVQMMQQDKNRPDAEITESDEIHLQETPPQYVAPSKVSNNMNQQQVVTVGGDEEEEESEAQARTQFYLPQRYYQILGSDKYLSVGNNGRFLLKSARSLDLNKEEKPIIVEESAKVMETKDDKEIPKDIPANVEAKVEEIKQIEEPIVKPVVKPIVETILEPVVKPVVEPVAEPTIKPALEPVVEPVVEVKDVKENVDKKIEETKVVVPEAIANVVEEKSEPKIEIKPELEDKPIEKIENMKPVEIVVPVEKEIDDGSLSTTTERPFIVKENIEQHESSTVAPPVIVTPSLNKVAKVLLRSEIVQEKKNGDRFLIKSEPLKY